MADETRREADCEHRAESEGSVQVSRPVPAQVEDALGQLDVEDVESTERCRLRAEQQDERARVRLATNERDRAAEGRRVRRRVIAALTGAAIASRAGTTSSAATAQIAAPTPNTTPGVLTVSTTPTSSGPPSVLTLSIQLETTFVAASSSGASRGQVRTPPASAAWW